MNLKLRALNQPTRAKRVRPHCSMQCGLFLYIPTASYSSPFAASGAAGAFGAGTLGTSRNCW
jgi:hypothetical protein